MACGSVQPEEKGTSSSTVVVSEDYLREQSCKSMRQTKYESRLVRDTWCACLLRPARPIQLCHRKLLSNLADACNLRLNKIWQTTGDETSAYLEWQPVMGRPCTYRR